MLLNETLGDLFLLWFFLKSRKISKLRTTTMNVNGFQLEQNKPNCTLITTVALPQPHWCQKKHHREKSPLQSKLPRWLTSCYTAAPQQHLVVVQKDKKKKQGGTTAPQCSHKKDIEQWRQTANCFRPSKLYAPHFFPSPKEKKHKNPTPRLCLSNNTSLD